MKVDTKPAVPVRTQPLDAAAARVSAASSPKSEYRANKTIIPTKPRAKNTTSSTTLAKNDSNNNCTYNNLNNSEHGLKLQCDFPNSVKPKFISSRADGNPTDGVDVILNGVGSLNISAPADCKEGDYLDANVRPGTLQGQSDRCSLNPVFCTTKSPLEKKTNDRVDLHCKKENGYLQNNLITECKEKISTKSIESKSEKDDDLCERAPMKGSEDCRPHLTNQWYQVKRNVSSLHNCGGHVTEPRLQSLPNVPSVLPSGQQETQLLQQNLPSHTSVNLNIATENPLLLDINSSLDECLGQDTYEQTAVEVLNDLGSLETWAEQMVAADALVGATTDELNNPAATNIEPQHTAGLPSELSSDASLHSAFNYITQDSLSTSSTLTCSPNQLNPSFCPTDNLVLSPSYDPLLLSTINYTMQDNVSMSPHLPYSPENLLDKSLSPTHNYGQLEASALPVGEVDGSLFLGSDYEEPSVSASVSPSLNLDQAGDQILEGFVLPYITPTPSPNQQSDGSSAHSFINTLLHRDTLSGKYRTPASIISGSSRSSVSSGSSCSKSPTFPNHQSYTPNGITASSFQEMPTELPTLDSLYQLNFDNVLLEGDHLPTFNTQVSRADTVQSGPSTTLSLNETGSRGMNFSVPSPTASETSTQYMYSGSPDSRFSSSSMSPSHGTFAGQSFDYQSSLSPTLALPQPLQFEQYQVLPSIATTLFPTCQVTQVTSVIQNRTLPPGPRPIMSKPTFSLVATSGRDRILKKMNNQKKDAAWVQTAKVSIAEITDGEKEHGDTILMIALSNNSNAKLELVYALVERLRKFPGALSVKNHRGYCALYHACVHNEPLAARYIAETVLDVEGKVEEIYDDGNTLLHIVCKMGDHYLDVLIELLSMKDSSGCPVFNVNHRNYVEGTPLHVAVSRHQRDGLSCVNIVRFLLDQGANILEKCGSNHNTPLHSAVVRSCDPSLISTILDSAAAKSCNAVNARNMTLDSPLHLAMVQDVPAAQQLKVIEILMRNGALRNAYNQKNIAPLQLAPGDRKEAIRRIMNQK